MTTKPTQPVTVRLACVVWRTGKLGNCVSASVVPAAQTAVDWARLRAADSAAFDAATPVDRAARIAAEARLSVALMPSNEGAKFNQVMVRFLTETVSPKDERPFYVASAKLPLRTPDVVFARPMDPNVVRDLFPVLAIRYGDEARVSIRCRIQTNGSLLCRDPGTVSDYRTTWTGDRTKTADDFLMASYQAASTLSVMPETKDGGAAVGRDLELVLIWSLPQ